MDLSSKIKNLTKSSRVVFLGIDPGYERCGFALLKKTQKDIEILSFGVLKTSSKDIFQDRLMEIGNDIQSLIKKHKPEVLVLEDLFFVQNVTTGMKVAQVRGVCTYLAKQHNMKVFEPKPTEVKSYFTGNGKADKNEMKKMVQLRFGLEQMPKIDDAADAIALASWGIDNIAFT